MPLPEPLDFPQLLAGRPENNGIFAVLDNGLWSLTMCFNLRPQEGLEDA
jgi:hypothetical protein